MKPRNLLAGLVGGLAGNTLLGVLFSLPFIRALLYDPGLQSQLYREITPLRNVPFSVAGLVVLAIPRAWMFVLLAPSMPARSRWGRGLFWGFTSWFLIWVPMEWFIYHTLLGEPPGLCALELVLLFAGSLVEGTVIALLTQDVRRVQ